MVFSTSIPKSNVSTFPVFKYTQSLAILVARLVFPVSRTTIPSDVTGFILMALLMGSVLFPS